MKKEVHPERQTTYRESKFDLKNESANKQQKYHTKFEGYVVLDWYMGKKGV